MKRFFIFAAMLLTMTANAVELENDPPTIKPPADIIVLIPQDMYEIERTIALCEYTLCPQTGTICITCHGTGADTELYLLDSRGMIVDHAAIDPDITPSVTFDMPETAGTYYIVLMSGRYHGEGTIRIN